MMNKEFLKPTLNNQNFYFASESTSNTFNFNYNFILWDT